MKLSWEIVGLGISGLCILKCIYDIRKLKIENANLQNRNWAGLVARKSKKQLEKNYDSLNGMYVCQVDSMDRISFSNLKFESDFGKHKSWTSFFNENFRIEKKLKGVQDVYKYVGDVTNDYYFNISNNDLNGVKTIFIQKMNATVLTKLANNRDELLETRKVNGFEMLENSIYKANSFKKTASMSLKEIEYADDLFVYLNDKQSEKLFDFYTKVVLTFIKLKGVQEMTEIKISRTDKSFIVQAFIPSIKIQSTDFGENVLFTGVDSTLGEVISSVGSVLPNYETSLIVKNVENNQFDGVCIDMSISDLDKVNIKAFEFSI